MCVYDLFRASRLQPLRLNCAVQFVAVFGLLFFAPSRPAHAKCPEYEITATVQGPECQFGGPPPTVGKGINDLGHICGWYNVCTVGFSVPFYWTPETGLVTLDMPDGAYEGKAFDISNDGVVVGEMSIANQGNVGFVWDDGEWTLLTPTNGNHAGARAINSKHQVTGSRDIDGLPHAFIWEDGKFIHDIAPTYGDRAFGKDINDNMQVTGDMGFSHSDEHAFFWDEGSITDLGPIQGGINSTGQAVNDDGVISGFGRIERNGETVSIPAFSWEDGKKQISLPHLDDFLKTFAWDINNELNVVGQSRTLEVTNNDQAFLWSNGNIHNINDLIDTDLFITLRASNAINESGQITGKAETQSLVAFVLTPIEPVAGDLNCDGYVDEDDLSEFLSVWDTSDEHADFSGDGFVNGADLGLLLSYWNPE